MAKMALQPCYPQDFFDTPCRRCILIINGGFFHKTCISEPHCQSTPRSTNSRSYIKCSFAKVVWSSIHARLWIFGRVSITMKPGSVQMTTHVRPRHARGPTENGWLASSKSLGFLLVQRSGSKIHGFSKLAEDILAAKGLVLTVVCRILSAIPCCESLLRTPAGTKRPSTIAPPSGTSLGRPRGSGGYTLRASRHTACKYDSLDVDSAAIAPYD